MASAGPQIETPYVLVGPDGTRAVFNDPTDPDYVGVLTAVTGIDSPEVRESFDDLTEFDGGVHGPFFYGRRPIVLEGLIYDHGTVAVRNERIGRLKRASDAMRADSTLTWTPDGSPSMFSTLRRQLPLRVDGGWNKTFQVPMVAADPRIYSSTLLDETVEASYASPEAGFSFPLTSPIDFNDPPLVGAFFITNDGDTETFPVYTIKGSGTDPSVTNFTTGKSLVMTHVLASNKALVIDTLARTVTEYTVKLSGALDLDTGVSKYSALNFDESEWGGLIPGPNEMRLNFATFSAGASLLVQWRSAWL